MPTGQTTRLVAWPDYVATKDSTSICSGAGVIESNHDAGPVGGSPQTPLRRDGPLILLQTQSAPLGRGRCRDLVRRVGRRWVVHLRRPPFLLNAPMRLLPGRKFRARLRPVNQSGFVTPVKQASHSRPVGIRMHECLHRPLGRPTRAGPECAPAILQQCDGEVAVSCRGRQNARRMEHRRANWHKGQLRAALSGYEAVQPALCARSQPLSARALRALHFRLSESARSNMHPIRPLRDLSHRLSLLSSILA